MKRMTIALALLFGLAALAMPRGAHAGITEEEARAVAVDAYIYLYPLVTMELTRKQSTNIEPGKEFGKGPMNMFTSVPVVRQPGDANTSVHMSSIGSR